MGVLVGVRVFSTTYSLGASCALFSDVRILWEGIVSSLKLEKYDIRSIMGFLTSILFTALVMIITIEPE